MVVIETLPNAVQAQTNISEDGELYRDLNLLYNKYRGDDDDLERISIETPAIPIGDLPNGSEKYPYNDNEDTLLFLDGGLYRNLNLKLNKYFDEDELEVVDIKTTAIDKPSDGVYQLRTTFAARSVDFY